MAKILALVTLLGLFALALWTAYEQWNLEAVEMPGWGWAALLLAGGLSILVGAGLMALMFYSSRKGYDDTAR
jgi:hypothetical protein